MLQEHGFEVTDGQGSHTKVRANIEGKVWRDTIVKPHGNRKNVHQAAVKKALKAIQEINAWKAELAAREESENGDDS